MDNLSLSNEQLHVKARELVHEERERLLDLLEVLATIDERRAYRDLQCASLYEYCVASLGLSEAAAYRRIRAVRAIRLFPPIAVLLREGRLTLETTTLLHPHLEGPDASSLVSQAAGKRTWQVARLLAARQAPPPQRDIIRFAAPVETPRLPEALPLLDTSERESTDEPVMPAPAAPSCPVPAVIATPSIQPSKPSFSIRVAFTADERFWVLLQRARAVLRHKYPDGRLESVLGDALALLLKRKDRDRRFTLPSRRPPKMAE